MLIVVTWKCRPSFKKKDNITKTVNEKFGNIVRACRAQRGISQEVLAERAGLHRTYIADIERGSRNPSLLSINKLAEALNLSLSSLFENQQSLDSGERNGNAQVAVDILLVEDNLDDAEMAISALKRSRLSNQIHHVPDSETALTYLYESSNPDAILRNKPSVILLDLNLPKMDGRTLLRMLKTDPRTRSIPVVILTVSEQSGDITACRQLGADAYIVKPVDFNRLAKIAPQLNYHWTLFTSSSTGG